jgi:tRNA(Ile2) C34 agmatinyltransferase TiaS
MEKPILSCPKCGSDLKPFGKTSLNNFKCENRECSRFYSAEKLDEMGV